MSNEILKDIAELRRNMPRNKTAMRICDALEERLIATSPREIINAVIESSPVFDKTAYQRNYMRARRAKLKENASA